MYNISSVGLQSYQKFIFKDRFPKQRFRINNAHYFWNHIHVWEYIFYYEASQI